MSTNASKPAAKKPAPAKKEAPAKAAPAAAPAKDKKPKKAVAATESKEQAEAAAGTEKKERKRREISKETVDTTFAALTERLEAEINRLRESAEKVRGIKFLRSINKAVKTLHSDTKRVMKLKKKNNRKKTTVSGFLKPIKISQELSVFTGRDVNAPCSRVEITKQICEYIKTHHLYNDDDKRLILCDDKLKALLKYDPANPPMDKEGKPAPLNYFRLQKYLKPHFIKIEAPKEEGEAAAEKKGKAKAAPAKKAAAKKAPAKAKVEVEDDVEEDEADDE
jgi:chromatin remodeling complex protein RSC6